MSMQFIKGWLINITILLCLFIFLFIAHQTVFAQIQQTSIDQSKQEFYTAKVLRVINQGVHTIQNFKNPYQTLSIQFLDGPDEGKIITITQGVDTTIRTQDLVKQDDTVIITKTSAGVDGKSHFVIYDKYRIIQIAILVICFMIIVFIIAGKKGLGSILGLVISLSVIILFIIPHILSGQNPLLVSVVGSIFILLITTYLAHGVSKQTTVALLSTFASLMITVVLATYFVNFAGLNGLNDETSTLIFGPTSTIDLQGLLLAGVIIGTLGALNDITTSQAAAIFELAKTDNKLRFKKLFSKGFNIGNEHIVSMVNTLVLAYAGSSLILFIFIVLNPAHVPYWVIINNELLSDEIVRTLAGSIGLLLVVPIVTAFAAAVCDKKIIQFFKS